MSDRLAEYFVVIGFDHQQQSMLLVEKLIFKSNLIFIIFVYVIGGGVNSGKVIQGFPEKEWNESPFVDQISTVS